MDVDRTSLAARRSVVRLILEGNTLRDYSTFPNLRTLVVDGVEMDISAKVKVFFFFSITFFEDHSTSHHLLV